MRCHYEVLCVARNADDAEIKRSYRKLALTHHPDKNKDNSEESTRIFHEIQAAYDVLSDKQERAWYDKHREAILKGGEDYVDDSVDVMHYFNPSVYNGFNDGAKGFYTIFRNLFRNISQEDEPYLEGDSDFEVPDFGVSTSSYDDVKPFYSYWLGYCTKKSFVWKEKYDLRQAPNRPTQRLMEKENKKSRDAAKRKRNEEVRELVSYVRKRDKRVQAYRKEVEEKQAENQRKMEKKRGEDIRNRNKELDNYKEQDWMAFDQSKLDDIDSHFDEQFGEKNNSDDCDVNILDHFYCIACDKTFKSEKALANHEKSKKHKENVELIKSELEDDLLEDLHIDERNDVIEECEKQSETCDSFVRLSSLNLPGNVVKLNVISTKATHCDDESDSMIRHTTDSLIYTKIKGTGAKQGSVKMKEKKKKKSKQSSLNEEKEEQEWRDRHSHLALSSQNSLFLPRKKSKKQEIRDSAERMRQHGDEENGFHNVSLGKYHPTDSMVINKKRVTKADRKKGRRQLLNSDEDSSSSEKSGDENDVFPSEHGVELDDAIVKNADNVDITDKIDLENSDVVKGDDEIEVTEPHLERSHISDSIRYNKERMEHHGKHIIVHKKIEKKKSLDEESNCNETEESEEHSKVERKLLGETELPRGTEKVSQKKGSNHQNHSTSESFSCEVCAKVFSTRNKLFGHIKSEGHAVFKDAPTKTKNGKKSKNKKK